MKLNIEKSIEQWNDLNDEVVKLRERLEAVEKELDDTNAGIHRSDWHNEHLQAPLPCPMCGQAPYCFRDGDWITEVCCRNEDCDNCEIETDVEEWNKIARSATPPPHLTDQSY